VVAGLTAGVLGELKGPPNFQLFIAVVLVGILIVLVLTLAELTAIRATLTATARETELEAIRSKARLPDINGAGSWEAVIPRRC
jgi:hypothetical protein